MRGAEIWVELGKPEVARTHPINNPDRPESCATYRTNLDVADRRFKDQQMRVNKAQVELLCRGENDFAEEVERVTYADFLKQRQQAINLEREPKLDG